MKRQGCRPPWLGGTGLAFAVAWEGAGGARAAEFSGVPYLEIRGISDGADSDAATNFREYLPLAMKNIATVITSLARMGVA